MARKIVFLLLLLFLLLVQVFLVFLTQSSHTEPPDSLWVTAGDLLLHLLELLILVASELHGLQHLLDVRHACGNRCQGLR